MARANVSLHLTGWPPPIIEIHALQSHLPPTAPGGKPAHAYQRSSEIIMTFDFTHHPGLVDSIQAQLIATEALAAVHDGVVTVSRVLISD